MAAPDVQQTREPIVSCEQCGTCSSACPVTGVDGFNIRRIEHAVQLNLLDMVAKTGVQWVCTMCGRCEEVCPNGYLIMDTTRGLRKMTPAELMPSAAPCQDTCPAHINIPQYLRLIAAGKPAEAYAVIREKVPFPGVLGRVCAHPCETTCKRAAVNEPIQICALKRYAADHADGAGNYLGSTAADTGKKVAVIGAGPAGLTTAFYLRKKGHAVTVFEEKDKAGGMMRYGIPSSRLPEDILDKEVADIASLGVEIKLGQKLGQDFGLDDLKAQGFEAIFLAPGLQVSRKIQLEGSDAADVLWGVEFLKEVAEGAPVALKPKVVVIGGGNVAVDVAMTALRCGAQSVTMASLESRDEMPAFEWEIEEAVEEGVDLLPGWGPSRIISNGDGIKHVELVQCTSVFDDAGAFCPMFGEDKKVVEADQVILAIGQAADLAFASGREDAPVRGGLLEVDTASQAAGQGVYAGGDASSKAPGVPGTIIEAIAAGRRAASAIDQSLGGNGLIDEQLWAGEAPEVSAYERRRGEGFATAPRVEYEKLPLEERKGNFNEVAKCFEAGAAEAEAKRCLQCDLEVKLALNGSGPAA